MPRPFKTDKPTTTEPVVEPIQGTTIVIIHPGSSTLHVGRATDHYPQSIPHVIARRLNDNITQGDRKDGLFSRAGIQHEESAEKGSHGLQAARVFLHSMRIGGGYRKPKTSPKEIIEYNKSSQPYEGDQDGTVHFTDTSHKPNYFIGEQALNIRRGDGYTCCSPFAYGQLNVHNGVGGSITAIAEDIETLWGSAIENYLNIPIKDLSFYRAVLVIPDMFNREHVKLLIDIVLNRLNFSCIIVAQESVCGAFGSGLSSTCVVDVGAQKTNICCIEDGISLPSTRLTFKYGGDDISRTFLSLLQASEFPYRSMDVDKQHDVALLHELKETFCHLSLDIPSGKIHEFQVMQPDSEESFIYKLKLGDEPILAPIALFVPDLFGIVGEELIETFPECQVHDKEDILDDRYLLEKKDMEPKKSKGETADQDTSQDSQPLPSNGNNVVKEHAKIEPLKYDGIPLDEAVMYSIEQCNNQETKRKMYSTVLLIGGGMNFKGADDFLTKRLQSKLPAHYQFMKEQLEVIARPKENDPRTASWKGGSVMSILDSSQELWISTKEWNQYGVRILRERCCFQWSSNMDKQ